MSVAGNINEVLKQLELLIKIYGNAKIYEIEKSIATVKNK